jgi:hypothetical protein
LLGFKIHRQIKRHVKSEALQCQSFVQWKQKHWNSVIVVLLFLKYPVARLAALAPMSLTYRTLYFHTSKI